MDYDKEFSDSMGKCIEGWGFIISEVINMNNPKLYPTEIHNISTPEKEEPKSSIRGKVVTEEDDNAGSGNVDCSDTSTSENIKTTNTATATDPPIPDPVGKEN